MFTSFVRRTFLSADLFYMSVGDEYGEGKRIAEKEKTALAKF
jgi:hypothetical protein